MKKLSLLLFIIIVSSCKEENKIKSYTLTEFATKQEGTVIKKDTIIDKYSIGMYPSGEQSYFVGLNGFSALDTTKYQDHSRKIKKDGDHFFYYDENGKLIFSEIKKGDTIWRYDSADLKKPSGYLIRDSKGQILQSADYLMNEHKTYKDRRFDKFGNMTYTIVEQEYLPDSADSLLYSEMEISKKKVEGKKTTIIETSFIYY